MSVGRPGAAGGSWSGSVGPSASEEGWLRVLRGAGTRPGRRLAAKAAVGRGRRVRGLLELPRPSPHGRLLCAASRPASCKRVLRICSGGEEAWRRGTEGRGLLGRARGYLVEKHAAEGMESPAKLPRAEADRVFKETPTRSASALCSFLTAEGEETRRPQSEIRVRHQATLRTRTHRPACSERTLWRRESGLRAASALGSSGTES